ncbi:hypothetical protein VE03_05223 [Pseudogymnoascus sp. 23342-1-I1]|nr:hypothetical protein VE03_05223 [Pseudogymnoascus sp. 23342-1-I1]
MSQSIDSQGWDRFKNVIRGLYMTKGNKLEGPEGVIKIMESQHEFKKTKAQYEKQFKDWGFKKNRTKRDWEIMNRKIQLRKRTGKESNVYLHRQLMPLEKLQKETARQGYMTTVEQARLAFEAPPQTPPGFDIRTPLAQPFFRLAFENLPILQFKEFAQPVYGNSITPFDISTSALTKIFQSPDRKNDSYIPPVLDSLLPMSAFLEEPRAAGLVMQRVEDIGHAELLNLAIFIASNNFPGDANAEELRQWLKTHGTTSVIEALSSMKGPTAEALLEKLFCFAIEHEDVSTVKYLLQVGVNPNGHQCEYDDYGDYLTPLQYALIQGNTELSLELIKAGSTTDHPNTGWKSSALVLAIIGDRMNGNTTLWGNDHKESGVFEDRDSEEYGAKDTRYGAGDYLATQEKANRLVTLIGSLINAGAVVNLSDIGQLRPTQLEMSEKLRALEVDEPDDGFIRLNYDEVHTPLSMASRCQRKDIVDLIIRKGADVNSLTDQGTSALHECLYSRDQMATNLVFGYQPQLQGRDFVSRGYKNLDAVVEVVQSLIDAGANVQEEFNCRAIYSLPDNYSGPESYIIFDLGVLTGSMEIVSMLISAGAQITALSVEYAIQFESLDVFNRSLHATASVSTNSALLTKRGGIRIKEVALLKAIHFGYVSTIEYLFRDGDFGCRDVLYKSTELVEAIESCCGRGHIRALRLVLENSLNCQFSLSPWFGGSLYWAISNRRDEVVDTLLCAGADVNGMISRGRTPLLAAIDTENEALLERLIGMGALLNSDAPYSAACSGIHGVSGHELTAAISWGNSIVINRLLEMGADIEAFGSLRYHRTDSCSCIRPLTAAIMAKNSDLVNELIRRGVKINNALDYGPLPYGLRMTPLAAAFQSRDFEMVDFVIKEGANPYDQKAAMIARCDYKLRRVLINAMHSSYQLGNIGSIEDALLAAVRIEDVEMVTAIISSPLWGILPGSMLSAALKLAIWFSYQIPDIETWVSDSPRMVEVFLEAGAESGTGILFNACYSPLQSAVKIRNHRIAQTLLHYGSNPNSVSSGGKYQDGDCRMPLQIAVENQDVETIKVLFRYKANANGTFLDDEETNSDIDMEYPKPRTPLQQASLQGSRDIVELLLENGADVNSPPVTGDGATALQYAAIYGFLGIAHLLLEHDADVNAPPAKSDGRTALEGAAEHGRIDMVQLLLNAGANIFGDGQAQYENATRRASENGHHAVRRMIEKYHDDRE